MKKTKFIEFDETIESLQKIFVLAEHIDIMMTCKKCGEVMTLILENEPLEKDGKRFPGHGLFCPNGHVSMLWTPPPKSDLELLWEEFERRCPPKRTRKESRKGAEIAVKM